MVKEKAGGDLERCRTGMFRLRASPDRRRPPLNTTGVMLSGRGPSFGRASEVEASLPLPGPADEIPQLARAMVLCREATQNQEPKKENHHHPVVVGRL